MQKGRCIVNVHGGSAVVAGLRTGQSEMYGFWAAVLDDNILIDVSFRSQRSRKSS